MAEHTISHKSLIKGIVCALSFFILILFLRIFLIFIPPIVVHASPKTIRLGQTVTLWGFMGFQDVRDASTLMLNAAPIENAHIQRWSFFSIRFTLTEQYREQLKKNAHGILYVQYKNYRSARFFISLSYNNATEKSVAMPSLPSITMLNKETIYPQDNLTFSFNSSQLNTHPIFIEEYSFIVKTRSATHTLYPHEWNTFSPNTIEFTVPVSLFPTSPRKSANAEIHVMYKNAFVGTHRILLTAPPILSSAAYEFSAEFAYDTASEEYFTTIIPLSRLWQRVSLSDTRTGATRHISDEQFRIAIAQGFIKNFDIKKLSFLITRYPFHAFGWKNLSALEERAAFSPFAHGLGQELSHIPFYIPRYLQDRDGYFHASLREVIYRSAGGVEESTVSLGDLIAQFAHEAERILSDATIHDESRILKITDRVVREFANSLQMPEISHDVKMLAITADILRNYGIPAQVIIGFAYKKEATEKLHMQPAVWLEIFTSSYGIIPLRVTKNVSTFSVIHIDYQFIGYTVLEHMAYLEHRNQRPYLFTKVQSFTLRD